MARSTLYNAASVDSYLASVTVADPVATYLAKLETGQHSHRSAAAAAGISIQTVYEWRRKYPAFLDAERVAEGRAVAALLADLGEHDDFRRAAAWTLERVWRYGNKRDSESTDSCDWKFA